MLFKPVWNILTLSEKGEQMKEITLKNNHFIWRTLLNVLGIDDYDEQDEIESIRLVVLTPDGKTREVIVKDDYQIWNDICREICGMGDYDDIVDLESVELTVDECESEAIKEDK
jgi:hypothetical protein